ncbi:Ser-Thr-rich GPI-anchored membrane family protein [Okeania sp.]|uniref:Ser-Thr-rich GPI-anchored membrane family protein n=1 Tax=Okeania sp. TaxID=3100323 RepID=UPI002B4B7FD0|nr:Ser-Thr-rich GPI-anchored membrane family protein [Okeania sp.]MEB3339337.1 Ser-Thr-rich GPI-anchored membrane family protein [Okeania sp.]
MRPLEYIELTSINNGETLEPGKTYEITWDTNITGNVRIDLYEEDSLYNFLDYNILDAFHKAADAQEIADELGLDDYDESLIGGGLAEDGSYTWTVPEDFVAGDEYEFKITSISDDTVYDFSNSKFSVEAAEDYINVTSFNVGGGVTRGETYEITWDTN